MAQTLFYFPLDVGPLLETMKEVNDLGRRRALPSHLAAELAALADFCGDGEIGRAPSDWFEVDLDVTQGRIEAAPMPRLMALLANLRACAERSDA